MSLILSLILCIVLFWCAQFYWKRRRLYELSRKVPGPFALPLIGSAYMFRGNVSANAKLLMEIFDLYPELSKLWLGNELYYLITKPEYLEIVLNSSAMFEKGGLYKLLEPIVGQGLLSGPVNIWKGHRKIIAPSLNQKILNEYPEAISEQCDILVEQLRKECGRGEIDHCVYLTNCAVDVVAETMFGIPIEAQAKNGNYSHLFDRLMEILFLRISLILYQFDFIFRWTKEYRDQEEIVKQLKIITFGLIERKMEQLEAQAPIEDKKKPFLDLMVEKYLNKELTREEVEDEVNTVLLAGTDTNATSTSLVLTLLGMHQDIQQRLYEEVIDVLGQDGAVKFEDLSQLKYTERTIKESLRIFPAAPLVGRVVQEDVALGDIIIPKGSNVALGLLHLHRSAKYWPDPLKFDPDRFLPERSANRHAYTWLPFSGGPRNCIGIKYGMMVMKIMVAMVVRKFRVSSSIQKIEDIELTTNIVLKPKAGFALAFEPR